MAKNEFKKIKIIKKTENAQWKIPSVKWHFLGPPKSRKSTVFTPFWGPKSRNFQFSPKTGKIAKNSVFLQFLKRAKKGVKNAKI